jgi:hypothetical protein
MAQRMAVPMAVPKECLLALPSAASTAVQTALPMAQRMAVPMAVPKECLLALMTAVQMALQRECQTAGLKVDPTARS